MSFPPGKYEAVQIVIGEGAGQNWWCLMFPPLCYVDMTAADESREYLAANVSEEGFRLLTHYEEPSAFAVRFKIVEWWQNRNKPIEPPPSRILQR
jgi:stage II sporulation protein R